MIRQFACWVLVAALWGGYPAAAQELTETDTQADATTSEQADPGAMDITPELTEAAEALPAVFADQDTWDSFAERAGEAVAQGRVSNGVLAELRSELAQWRDTFLDREDTNSGRVQTVREQIAALGDAPETGEEDPRVALRRAELTTLLQELQAPGKLAAEAYTQANGLIGEIDSLVRERQADSLTERSLSPLRPSGWTETYDALSGAVRSNRVEIQTQISNPSRWSEFVDRLPAIIALIAVALVLVLRGRTWFGAFSGVLEAHTRRGQGVVRFVLSLGQIIIPLIGIVALSNALELTSLLGRRSTEVVESLPALALFPILAHWLAGLLLPKTSAGADTHPLELPPEQSARGHRRFIILGYALMAFGCVGVFAGANSLDPVPTAVLKFPFGAVMAWTLYWMGRKLRHKDSGADEDAQRSFRQTIRGLVSSGIMLAAVAGLIFAALGYATAFEAITYPAATSLYVLGILYLLQQLSVDGYTLLSKSDNAAQDALIPVLIGAALVFVAVPILALIWGAQVTDITELWARFREGFSIGTTQISPTSFLMFAVIFVIGFTVTRLLQAALRSTILPRTGLDIGGQNAIVAGMGYVGVFLAALIAITTAGIDLSGLAIVAGALSVGIGFGLQNIVSNFVAGIILLIERPISEGDWIEVGGQMGYVRDISVRSTRIETFDRTDVIVPNADLVSGQVTNWTRGNNVGRVIVPVGVAYGTDTDRVAAILQQIAEDHPMVLLNPPPGVIFQGFGADSLDFEIRAILRDVNRVLAVKSDLNHAIAKRFVEEGIEIPFAQRDLWLRNPETLNFNGSPASEEPDT